MIKFVVYLILVRGCMNEQESHLLGSRKTINKKAQINEREMFY